MESELLLLRHGKSDWGKDVEDFDRPLKDRGKRAAQRVGNWLLEQGLIPDRIISSPAERAITTAEKCTKAMGLSAGGIQRDPRIYEAGVAQLYQLLQELPADTRRVMLVGHNPGLEQLLQHLLQEPAPVPDDGKLLPTATLARLQLNRSWAELADGCASLLALIRPDQLPKRFPWPGPEGSERRPRPAYYYTQSSVIPWRRQAGQLEILIVGSSKRKHWVIPKGIQEPGLTPQASAAKEAMEEAGVEGVVADRALGHYDYEKWGATCTVSVYPMQVTRLIPDAQWQERHRERRWVTPEQAAKQVREAALQPMIHDLAASLTGRS